MPNHCETDLTFSGPKAVLEEIISKYITENGELNCDVVIPYPARYKELDEAAKKYVEENRDKPDFSYSKCPRDGYNQGGYEWCVRNWGTKWGTYRGNGVNRKSRSFSISFDSAWAPPTPVVQKLAEMYPQVKISMKSYERGAAYKLDYRWKGAFMVKELESKYRGNRGG